MAEIYSDLKDVRNNVQPNVNSPGDPFVSTTRENSLPTESTLRHITPESLPDAVRDSEQIEPKRPVRDNGHVLSSSPWYARKSPDTCSTWNNASSPAPAAWSGLS